MSLSVEQSGEELLSVHRAPQLTSTPRRRRRTLDQVISDLSTSKLGEPSKVNIPILDGSAEASSLDDRDLPAPGTLLQPQPIHVSATIRRPTSSVSTQTTLHLDPDQVILVLPPGGGKLQ